MDAKSVITSPSPQAPIRHGAGPLVITGLAWSGMAGSPASMCRLDGGNTWVPARITGEAVQGADAVPLRHDWDGSEMFIMSRAMDETGYVQPTKQALRDIRGLNNVYHNNGIQTWWVAPTERSRMSKSPEFPAILLAGTCALIATTGHDGLAGQRTPPGRRTQAWPRPPRMPEEIDAWDVAVLPDGTGLPEGSGDVDRRGGLRRQLRLLPRRLCRRAGQLARSCGRRGTLTDPRPVKTVGSYWPHLSTVFDYVHRSMPFGGAQTLSVDDTYAITAFLLYSNGMVEDDFVLTQENFTEVVHAERRGLLSRRPGDDRVPAVQRRALHGKLPRPPRRGDQARRRYQRDAGRPRRAACRHPARHLARRARGARGAAKPRPRQKKRPRPPKAAAAEPAAEACRGAPDPCPDRRG
jgi:hypothetical protein